MTTNEVAREISLKIAQKIIERARKFIQISEELEPLPSEKGIHIKVSTRTNPEILLLNVLTVARDELVPGVPLTITNLHKDYEHNA